MSATSVAATTVAVVRGASRASAKPASDATSTLSGTATTATSTELSDARSRPPSSTACV